VQFTIEGGYLSIGLEIDTARCAMVAYFLQNILGEYPLLKVALFNKNIAIPGNWPEVAVFYFWDRVSPSYSPKCINIFTFMILNSITAITGVWA
jgi:hypothetical protein